MERLTLNIHLSIRAKLSKAATLKGRFGAGSVAWGLPASFHLIKSTQVETGFQSAKIAPLTLKKSIERIMKGGRFRVGFEHRLMTDGMGHGTMERRKYIGMVHQANISAAVCRPAAPSMCWES
jgi:hypothetical protein